MSGCVPLLQVVGVDYGGRFISIAKKLQQNGVCDIGDGDKITLPFNDINTKNVTFKQVSC